MRKIRSCIPLKTAKIGCIIMSSVLCIIGIMLIAVPEFSVSVLGIVFGITLTVFGIVRIVGYLSRDFFRLAFQYDLVFGAIMTLTGVMLLVNPKNMMTVICVASGISIFAEAISKINIALETRRFGIGPWWLIMVSAVISGLFGLLLVFRPGESRRLLVILLGITLLSEGILNLVTVIITAKAVKNSQPDIIEAEFRDKTDDPF